MTCRIAAAVVLLALVGAQAAAQSRAPVAVRAGVGNLFGGLGVVGEFVVRGHLSAALGVGVIPKDPMSVAAAAAVRLYTSRTRHRPFLQFSIAPLAVTYLCDVASDCWVERTHYGPGIVLGYTYVARSGFTVIMGAGAGWDAGERYPIPMAQLGFGYTFKRNPP